MLRPNEDKWAAARGSMSTLDAERFAERKETLDEFKAGHPLYDNTNTAVVTPPVVDPNDLSSANAAAAAMADLATLKADATVGDGGSGAPAAFAPDQYIVIRDGSKVSYDGSVWSAGPAVAPGPASAPTGTLWSSWLLVDPITGADDEFSLSTPVKAMSAGNSLTGVPKGAHMAVVDHAGATWPTANAPVKDPSQVVEIWVAATGSKLTVTNPVLHSPVNHSFALDGDFLMEGPPFVVGALVEVYASPAP